MPTHINIFLKENKPMTGKKEKKKKKPMRSQYILSKPKSIIVFTHSHNKYYNTFIKHLFLVVVGHSLIFYYFISTYKKLASL